MIPKHLEKLAKKITKDFAAQKGWHAPKDPEQWLTALLLTIEAEINEPSAMLRSAVGLSFLDNPMAKAERLLRKQKGVRANGKRKNRKAFAAAR